MKLKYDDIFNKIKNKYFINKQQISCLEKLEFICKLCNRSVIQNANRFTDYLCQPCKAKQSKLLKYGNANYTNHQKAKQTNIKKYGVDNPSKIDRIKEKIKKTNIERYGNSSSLHGSNQEKIKSILLNNRQLKDTTKIFIIKAKLVHGDKYDYSLVKYINSSTTIKIICPIHGIFKQKANNHLQGNGCLGCIDKLYSKEHFLLLCDKAHNHKYDYSKTNYIGSGYKIEIICLKHGSFWTTANNHLSKKSGCPKCRNEKLSLSISEFINRANKVHHNKFDYSKVNYINIYSKVIIICPIHGEFFQKPCTHLAGKGCAKCRISKGEQEIKHLLNKNNILFEREYTFTNCKNINLLPFDFYLPKHNTCIEYDGRQHFEPIKWFGGEEGLRLRKINDEIKNKYCIDNNINLIRIKYTDIKDIEKIIKRL